METINWSKATKEDYELVSKIVSRAVGIVGFGPIDKASLNMDIIAVHVSGCTIKLQELLDSPLADFTHDIDGISWHIDRRTGQLKNCFLPRYSA